MAVESITISAAWLFLLAAAGGFAAIWKVVEIVAGWFKPERLRRKSVEDKLRDDNARLKSLEEDTKELKETNAVLFRAVLAQINHELDGNHVDGLRRSRDEIQNYLTNRR